MQSLPACQGWPDWWAQCAVYTRLGKCYTDLWRSENCKNKSGLLACRAMLTRSDSLRVLYTTLRTCGEAEVTPEATGNYLTQPPGPDCPHLPPPPSDDQYLLMLPAPLHSQSVLMVMSEPGIVLSNALLSSRQPDSSASLRSQAGNACSEGGWVSAALPAVTTVLQ